MKTADRFHTEAENQLRSYTTLSSSFCMVRSLHTNHRKLTYFPVGHLAETSDYALLMTYAVSD